MGLLGHTKEEEALRIGGVSGSFYGSFNAPKMTIRRSSDDAFRGIL
jgi:hypothetical protein